MSRKIRSAGIVVAMLIVIGALGVLLYHPAKPSFPPLPTPNGYDFLAQAGELIGGDPSLARKMKAEDLRLLIITNSEALRIARTGLGHNCRQSPESLSTNDARWIVDLVKIKRLAQLFAAEARWAELDGRPTDALLASLDAVKLGNEASRGGFLIQRLVGIAMEVIGIWSFQTTLTNAPPSTPPLEVIRKLEAIDAQGVEWSEVSANEKYFMSLRRTNFHQPIEFIRDWRSGQKALRDTEQKHQAAIAIRRLLLAEAAIRAFHSERHHLPQSLAELVPSCLAAVPVDPFSGKAIAYRPQGTNWLIYSVGPDGKDDGGVSVSAASATDTKGDLLLTTPW